MQRLGFDGSNLPCLTMMYRKLDQTYW